MFPFFAGLLFMLSGVEAPADTVLVGFDKCALTTSYSNKNATVEADGFEGNQVWSDHGTLGDDWKLTTPGYGSQDGTFGSLGTGATTGTAGDDGAFWTKNTNNTSHIDITVENNTSDSYELTWFCFDAWRQYSGGSDGYSLSVVGGDLDLTNNFATGTFSPNSTIAGYADYDVSLTSLPETVLVAGASVTFRLSLIDSDYLTKVGQLFVDNIACLGEPVSSWHNMMVRNSGERDRAEIGGDGSQVPRVIVFSPKNNYRTVFMGIDTAGVYRSDDGGASWTSKMDGIEGYFIRGLAVDPVAEDRLYALADANGAIDISTKGLYISEDNGETWAFSQHFNLQGMPRDLTMNLVAVVPDSYSSSSGLCEMIFVGSSEGLFASMDGGDSFAQVGTSTISNSMVTAVQVHPENNSLLYVGTEQGLFKSEDGGVTFSTLNDGLDGDLYITALCADSSTTGRVFAIVDDQQVYRKTGTNSWVDITSASGLPVLSNINAGAYFYDIKVHPLQPDHVMLGAAWSWEGRCPYFSTDGGDTWELKNNRDAEDRFAFTSNSHNLTPPLAFAPHPVKQDTWMKAFNYGSMFMTTNACENWVWSNENYGGFRGLRLIVDEMDPNHFLINSVDYGVMVTFDGGQSFERASAVNYGKVDALGAVIVNDSGNSGTSTVWAGIGYHSPRLDGVLQKSTDGGLNFEIVDGTQGKQKAAVIIPEQNSDYIYAGDVFSLDGGTTWTDIGATNCEQIVAVDPDDEDTVYLFDGDRIYRSTENGLNYTVLKDLGYNGYFASSFIGSVVLNAAGDKLYIGHDGGLYIYDIPNDTLDFKDESDGFVADSLGRLDLLQVCIDPQDDNVIYAGELGLISGTGSWVFKSSDAGETWTSLMTDDVFGNGRVWGLGVSLDGVLWSFSDHGPFWYGDCSVPDAVSGLTADGSSGSVLLDWTADADACTYQVKRALSASGPFEVLTGEVAVSSYTDLDVVSGQTYYYCVAGANLAGVGTASETVTVTIP